MEDDIYILGPSLRVFLNQFYAMSFGIIVWRILDVKINYSTIDIDFMYKMVSY